MAKITNTQTLTKTRISQNNKNSKSKLFGTHNNLDLDKGYLPLSWEEIDSIPCIGEDIC
jgi:hypothetical protein